MHGSRSQRIKKKLKHLAARASSVDKHLNDINWDQKLNTLKEMSDDILIKINKKAHKTANDLKKTIKKKSVFFTKRLSN